MSTPFSRPSLNVLCLVLPLSFAMGACAMDAGDDDSAERSEDALSPPKAPSTAHLIDDAQAAASRVTGGSSVTEWKTLTGSTIGGCTPTSAYDKTGLATSSADSDADTTKFYNASGCGGVADVMFTRHLTSAKATHVLMDMNVMIDKPQNLDALEIAALKSDGLLWMKLSTQCNYRTGAFRGYDPVKKSWVDLGVPCVKASAGKWQRQIYAFHIANELPYFDSITFDDAAYSIGKSLHPAKLSSSSESLGIHLQTDAFSTGSVAVYVDNWKVYYW